MLWFGLTASFFQPLLYSYCQDVDVVFVSGMDPVRHLTILKSMPRMLPLRIHLCVHMGMHFTIAFFPPRLYDIVTLSTQVLLEWMDILKT